MYLKILLLEIILFTAIFNVVHGDDVPSEQFSINVTESKSYNHFRLPTSVRPESYKLKIITHLDADKQFQFKGKVFITFIVTEETNNITLHSDNLTIDAFKIEVKSFNNNGDIYSVKNIELNAEHDYYIIFLKEILPIGKYQIYIPFSNELNKNLYGYYLSSYVEKATKKKRYLSTTQFEPTSARKAFPCFDEPAMKAKFKIYLAYKKIVDGAEYQALSNMPLKSSTDMKENTGWVWDEFEETVPMSTYLVAYTINDFGYKQSGTSLNNNVIFKTWSRKDALFQTAYASELGPKVLNYYEDYFNIKFPLKKIDQIAIPDFPAGAMENWGLVTYRETALLYAENASTTSTKFRVASVVAHELAHQWFGNLVTMDWWTDLWLNEGFATYIASLGVENFHPEWNSLMEESVDNTLNVFKVDALKSSHPISAEIGPANEIPQLFDSISYDKGSCVIRMMHLFLGEKAFRQGVSEYLKKHSYKNAVQDNLWSSLTQAAHNLKSLADNINIKDVMDSWTLQTGYPIVRVIRDYSSGLITITQSRYLLDTYASRDNAENCWFVPLSYTIQSLSEFNRTTPQNWLTCNNKQATAINIKTSAVPDEWVLFNIQLSGLYKVKYDEQNWNLLIDALNSKTFKEIHVINRAQLIDDALTLAWTGDEDYNIALRVIQYLKREDEYIPWKSALGNLKSVERILKKTPEYEFFKKYMKKVLSPIYERMEGINVSTSIPSDSEAETFDVTKLKVLVASWSCKFEVGDCVSRSQEYFKLWQYVPDPDTNNPIPIDLRSVVYCTASKYGTEDEWNFLWDRYQSSNVASEKQTILRSLGCSKEAWLLSRYLNWAFNETQVRKQDSYAVFSSIASHQEIGYHLAKDYLLDHIDTIYNYYAPETSKLSNLIKPITVQMNSNNDLATMKEFVAKNKKLFEKNTEAIKRSLETIEINSQWKSRNYNEISKELRRFA